MQSDYLFATPDTLLLLMVCNLRAADGLMTARRDFRLQRP